MSHVSHTVLLPILTAGNRITSTKCRYKEKYLCTLRAKFLSDIAQWKWYVNCCCFKSTKQLIKSDILWNNATSIIKTESEFTIRIDTFLWLAELACLTLQPPNYSIWIFTHLKLCLADAIHNFKWVKIIQIWQNGGHLFSNIADWCHISSLSHV